METDLFDPRVRQENNKIAEERFGIRPGQFFATYTYKNLFWVLDGITIGYGDLRATDIAEIHARLKEGEVFCGFNEHHGSQFQQTPHPMIQITKDAISFPIRERGGL